MGKRAALETLGCKVNQYESAFFLEALSDSGYEFASFNECADLYIVHSCAVTARASYQTRQLLRRARRINPGAIIVVAGCAAQLEPDRFATEGLATHILGNSTKFDLPSQIAFPGTLAKPSMAIADPGLCRTCVPLPVNRMLSGRARAFLKIQDGCDAFCTYCVVPLVRGRSRSLPLEQVSMQMDRFLDAGFNEVVFTGIHLGQWGKDLMPQRGLPDLLAHFSDRLFQSRIRLSSLEPMEWNSRLLDTLTAHPWICSHFHVPLQSGDEEVLQRMARPYSPREYSEIIRELKRRRPGAAIGADVMAGFPSETGRAFENTCRFLEELPVTYLHVFPYSPRPGTAAARWNITVDGSEIKRRTQILRRLGQKKREAFYQSAIGTIAETLIETRLGDDRWQGTSDNYLPVVIRSTEPLAPGLLVNVRLTHLDGRAVVGQLLSDSHGRRW